MPKKETQQYFDFAGMIRKVKGDDCTPLSMSLPVTSGVAVLNFVSEGIKGKEARVAVKALFEEKVDLAVAEIEVLHAEIEAVIKKGTKFSCIVAHEEDGERMVKIVWAGKSPAAVFTPAAVYTTFDDKAKTVKEVQSAEFCFMNDTPVFTCAFTDGFLNVENGLDGAAALIEEAIAGSKNQAAFMKSLQNGYRKKAKKEADTSIAGGIIGDHWPSKRDFPGDADIMWIAA